MRRLLLAVAALAGSLVAMRAATSTFYDAYGVGILNIGGGRDLTSSGAAGYSADTAYTWLAAYGPSGRDDHLLILLLDLPLIASMTAVLVLGTRLALKGLRTTRTLRGVLSAFPLAGVALNLVEDLAITGLVSAYPQRLDFVAGIAGAANAVKSVSYGLAVATLVAALGARLLWRIRCAGRVPA
ncbi:hypothetical protein GCM10022243_34070 [Saccharothrix violaceirubra]|uniref:Uncharacterized protein n=1 Tax=Saccharothrix violaceirubra TaxID=413306 RepID=A0A7W7T4L0_9PSEU|nr:hypothetical protein [Saccharothrix violaceirubra]MBB4966460.1 hypothetical protein [Saccharothrix violaceirubra]